MRILIVDPYYPAFLSWHYGQSHELADEPYERQWRTLMERFFGTADSYSHYLGELGHAAHELVTNCDPLQRAWAGGHGLRGRRLRRPSMASIAVAQVEDFQPDVVYMQTLTAFEPEILRELGRGRLLVGQIASELPDARRLESYDLIVTSFPHFVHRVRERGLRAEYLQLGFDPRVFEHVQDAGPAVDVAFVGGLGLTQHRRGNDVLGAAAERLDVDFWGTGQEQWPNGSPVKRNYRGEAWGLEMYRVLARSRIALNRHIDVAEDFANNMRLYEATGVGALVLTDEKRNLADLFEPGKEVVAYSDADDLVEKATYYLAHEEERARVAAAGQRRTLRDHSWKRRMAELVQILDRHL